MWGLGPLPRQVLVGGLELSLLGRLVEWVGNHGVGGFALLQPPADDKSQSLVLAPRKLFALKSPLLPSVKCHLF